MQVTNQALMTFGQAWHHMNNGYAVTREGWNGKGQWVKKKVPDPSDIMTGSYCYLSNTTGAKVPWVPSQGDMWADDWFVVEI